MDWVNPYNEIKLDWTHITDYPVVDQGVEIEVDYEVIDERVTLPDDLFPPIPDVGYKAILLAVCSIFSKVLNWWRKLS